MKTILTLLFATCTIQTVIAASDARSDLTSIAPLLEQQIRALPEISPEQLRKKVVLLYQWEKLQKAIAQKADDVGHDIAADIKEGIGKNIGRKEGNHPWLQPVRQASANPFLDQKMNETWYRNFAAKPDVRLLASTQNSMALPDLYGKKGTFTQAELALDWMMGYVHPQSPLVDKPELLLRVLRRIDGYMDDCYHNSVKPKWTHYHFFAMGPAIVCANIIDKTYPELLLPRQKARWTKAITDAGIYYDKGEGGDYSNSDLGCGGIRLACGLFLGNAEYVRRGIKQIYTWDNNIFEDGGTSYIANQNESPGYHSACIGLAYNSYLATRDPKILEMLRKLEFYPISINDSNRTSEWYTAPSWKQSWYSAGATSGNRIVYYLTGNPYYHALRKSDELLKPKEPSMKTALIYQSYPFVEKALPNHYTLYDRNIQGVRMNYGLYSAAMNGRVTAKLVGKNTYVGLTLAEPAQGDQKAFSAAVYGINAFPLGAPTISKENISVALGRDFASLGANYTLARRMSGPGRREVPWQGRQTWLYLPDRMIGLVELTPDGTQKAKAITLNMELGRAKSGARDRSPAIKIDDRNCKFGHLLIKVLETNFAGIKLSPKPDGLAADGSRGPHHEFHLVDQPNLTEWSATARPYQGTSYAVIELKPSTSLEESKVQKIQQDGLIGLSVQLRTNRYTTLYNSDTEAVRVTTADYTSAGKSSIFADRTTFAAPTNVPASVSIPAKQSILIISGNNPRLHQPCIIGWKNFMSFYEKNLQQFQQAP